MPRLIVFRSFIAAIAIGQLACTNVTSDWWTFQHDSRRTGFVPGGIGPAPQPYWQVPLVTGTVPLTPPVFGAIGDTFRIFIGSGYGDGRLFALSPYTGATLWTFTAPPNTGLFGAPAAADSNVYFATRGALGQARVYAVSQRTGAVLWQMPLPGTGSYASIAVGDGRVFVNTDAHQLVAFSRYTGAQLWTANTSPGTSAQPSSPSLAYGRVYVGSDDGLFAFDHLNGTQAWKYNLTDAPGFSSAVIDTASPPLVFIGTHDAKLHAVNATTGANVWTYAASASMAFGSVAAGNGLVYIFDASNVNAIDRNTGKVVWTQPSPNIPRHSPAIAGRALFFHDDQTVRAFNALTGAPGWSAAVTGSGTANAPGSDMGIALEILLVPNKGQLHAFR